MFLIIWPDLFDTSQPCHWSPSVLVLCGLSSSYLSEQYDLNNLAQPCTGLQALEIPGKAINCKTKAVSTALALWFLDFIFNVYCFLQSRHPPEPQDGNIVLILPAELNSTNFILLFFWEGTGLKRSDQDWTHKAGFGIWI